MNSLRLAVVVVVATLCLGGVSRADVLLDRLGPTNQGTSSGRSQLEVSGTPAVINTQKMVGVPLAVSGGDYFLTSVDSSFSRGNTSSPEVSFELWGAHATTGNPDRNQIIESSPTRLVVPGGTGVVQGTFTFSGTSLLTAGVTYWIVARKQTGPGSVFTTENVIGNTSPWVFTSNGFLNGVASSGPTTFPGPALRVNGTPVPPACCPADFNCSGGLEVQDIFDFLNAWFAGNLDADFNNSGALEVQDIFDFLNAWFAGC